MATEPKSPRKSRHDPTLVEAELPRRLRAKREQRKLSVRELARRLDVSPSAISQIETGRARPSVSTLYAIVAELGMSLDELFRPEGTEPGEVPVRGEARNGRAEQTPFQRQDDRTFIELETGVRWERLTPRPDPDVDFLFVTYPVGSSSSGNQGLMRHAGQEYGVILSGRLEVTVGFDSQELEPGDSVSFDSMVPHRLRNVGNEPVTGVWIVFGRRGTDGTAAALDGAPSPTGD